MQFLPLPENQSSMYVTNTNLDEVKIIEPKLFGDKRGFFLETWNQKSYDEAGITARFVQDNHSRSSQGVLRGLHYQIENPQGKLVRVSQGVVFDVAVDMRKSSKQFGQWTGVLLTEENNRQLWVPEGFAHGFFVLSNTADFQYKCTNYYSPEHERTLMWNDVSVGVEWPELQGAEITLSEKDAKGLPLKECDTYS